ncbi:LAME_0D06414g1_1 [Lachancea meyersii CBS 8951]|uniref:Aminopeptidase n=1 Tax=Lachancea meyersii CBS 8951 TaxID=1266667 RepID=A0A1G4J951_9SACH|nr:LAME_0D06414g1_1 [Lachancea meyersii CBS 8951]
MLSLSNPVVPTNYAIELTIIDPSKANFRGLLRADLTINKNRGERNEFKEFSLHAEEIVVLSAKIGSQELNVTFDRSSSIVTFHFESGLKVNDAGEWDPLVVEYVGKLQPIKTFQDVTRGVFKTNYMDIASGNSNHYVVATHSQPGFAKRIFPCIDELNHKAFFQLSVKTLRRFVVASNTQVETESDEPTFQNSTGNSDSMKKVSFTTTPLMAPSLFGFVLGDLHSIDAQITLPQGKLPIRFLAAQQVNLAAFALDTVCEYLPALQELFKCKYPLAKLDFALLPFLSDMAMENFGLITIRQDHLLLDPSVLADETIQNQVQQLVVHELVHQWMGNYISFDSWEHLWFNEAFATWCACELISTNSKQDYWSSAEYLQQLSGALLKDGSADSQSIASRSKIDQISQTSDAVDPYSYCKGISILRSLQCSIGKDNFKSALQSLAYNESFHKRCIKPSEIWSFFGQQLGSANISNFMFSWIQSPGFPVLHVTCENGNTLLKQNRFQSDKDNASEDVPFHIPLFTLLPDGSEDKQHILMTDRSLKLPFKATLFNSDVKGYYRVSYESAECYGQLCEALASGQLSDLDLYGVFRDLDVFIGDESYQKREHLNGLIQLLCTIASRVDLNIYPKYYRGLSLGLTILQQLELSDLRFGSGKENKKYSDIIITPLFNQIQWPESFHNVRPSIHQALVMSQVLSAGKTLADVQSLSSKYFRKILQGPQGAIPFELVESILTVNSFCTSTLKQWKKHYDLVKSSQGLATHVSGCSVADIQDAALESIGFCTEPQLVQKLLNFVSSNFSSAGSEKALFGLSNNAKKACGSEQIRDVVWAWFDLHFDQWAKKSSTGDSVDCQRSRNTLLAVSVVVFEMWQDMPEKVDAFATAKQSKFGGDLRVADVWTSVKRSQIPKMTIYKGLLGF